MGILGRLFLLAGFAGIAGRLAARRRRELEEQHRAEESARGRAVEEAGAVDAAAVSPFGMFPFGGLFEGLLTGPGSWSRSYAFDEETGRWVDISDLEPEPAADSGNGAGSPSPAADTEREARQPPRRRRSSSLTSRASARPAVRFITCPTRKP